MSTLVSKSGKWLDCLMNTMAVISAVLLLFMMLLVCYDVVMRYLFKDPTGWAMEICEYLLVYITFLGSPWLLREKGHVNVDILFFFFPKADRRCNIFTSLAAAISTFILFVFSLAATWDYYQRGITMIKILTVPKWLVFWVIPLGCIFLCFEALRQFYNHLKNSQPASDGIYQSSALEKK